MSTFDDLLRTELKELDDEIRLSQDGHQNADYRPQYVGSFYFNLGWQNASRKALPELLSSLELDKCHKFDEVVDALRDNNWGELVPSPDHWNFTKDGCSCEVRGPGAQAEFHFWE